MNGLHFFIALTEIDREMHQNFWPADRHGVTEADEHEQQMSRLRRLFRAEPAPVAALEPPHETSQPRRAA